VPERIQLRRTKGWRKPEGAIYVGRPSPYGNPFPVDSDWMTWMAIAIGFRADKDGRRQAAVALHRAWITKGGVRLREYAPIQNGEYDGGALEFGDGSVVSMADHVAGIATWGASLYEAPTLPERPDLEPLRGHDLACWCPPGPCHADVLLELANA
jgi:hypothetical protein